MRYGSSALSDSELLAIVLRTGTRGRPVLEMASDLLRRYNGSLAELCGAGAKELCRIPGIGVAKSVELCAVFALVRRLAEQRLAERPKMNSPEKIANYMRDVIGDSGQEEFHVLMLDSQMCLIRNEIVTIGLVDRSLVHAREVFRMAIREASSSVILCHNHPSGDVKPSANDIQITKLLCQAGEIIGIKIVDHVIVGRKRSGGTNFYSFLANGQIGKETEPPEAKKTGLPGAKVAEPGEVKSGP